VLPSAPLHRYFIYSPFLQGFLTWRLPKGALPSSAGGSRPPRSGPASQEEEAEEIRRAVTAQYRSTYRTDFLGLPQGATRCTTRLSTSWPPTSTHVLGDVLKPPSNYVKLCSIQLHWYTPWVRPKMLVMCAFLKKLCKCNSLSRVGRPSLSFLLCSLID